MNETSHHIVVVGAGGNIGSHLVPHLARVPDVDRVTLIDKDVYESANLESQDITPRDVGKRKAIVQARKLRRINARVRVHAIADAVERVPLGWLRADVILACLDSRISRKQVNQFAWRLGVPLIDAGVESGGLLARVNVYVPGADNPCLECAWDERDYEALEQRYPCLGFAASTPATNAPSSLGALAASLQAIECQKLLSQQNTLVAIGKQVLIDGLHHKHYVTTFRRNANCRFTHDVWHIEKLSRSIEEITLQQALRLAPSAGDFAQSFSVEGKPFVKRLTCMNCGATRSVLRFNHSLSKKQTRCRHCGQQMVASGFDLVERLSADSVSQHVLSRSLRALGLRPRDVFSVSDGNGEYHYETSGNQ